MANQLSSLDVLAEAALFCSANQENDAQVINCPAEATNCPPVIMNPKKRKHYLIDLFEAEQRKASKMANSGFVDPNSSGFSLSPLSSSPEPCQSAPISPASYPSSPTATESAVISPVIPAISSPISPAINSTAKKSKSSKSKKANPATPASSNVKSAAINEFVKKVSITPKLEANSPKSLDELRESVFDENVKIEVKTPKLTYTLRGMRTRKPSTKTPDHLKDEDYFAKRERNNLAARKSRNNKNAAIRTSALKLKQLEAEREELDLQLGQEVLIMKFLQMKMEADPALKERVMSLVEEKQLTCFSKVLGLKSEFSL